MAFHAGEYQLAAGEVGDAVAWCLVYYQAGGLYEYYSNEDPGAEQVAAIARHALSGGEGECRYDTLWAIGLAYRWPHPGAAGEDEVPQNLLEEKAREVHRRGRTDPQKAEQRGQWASDWNQRHSKQGVIHVELRGKGGDAGGGTDAWSNYKGSYDRGGQGGGDAGKRSGGADYAADRGYRRGGGWDAGPAGSGDRWGSSWARRRPTPSRGQEAPC